MSEKIDPGSVGGSASVIVVRDTANGSVHLVPVEGLVSKEQVRALFPEVAAVADKIRAEFGAGVKLVYAEENGRCIGKRVVVDPDRVVKLSEMVLDSRPYAEILADREKSNGRKRAK